MIDAVSPVMTEGARRWIRDLAGQFQAAGIKASFAFSMECLHSLRPRCAPSICRYTGGVVSPGADVYLGVPSHQMHFGTRVRTYLRQMYKECADQIEAAGLPVVLQFGETQWWYFDNQRAGRARRDAATMTRTRSATSRRRRATRFGRSLPTRMIRLATRRTRTRPPTSCATASGPTART